jgi:AraC-like DNA-binding protein
MSTLLSTSVLENTAGKVPHLKNIDALLTALHTEKPVLRHSLFHIHRHEAVEATHVAETSLFRSCAYAVGYLKEGEVRYQIGLTEYEIKPGSLYFIGPKHLRQYQRLSPCKGFSLLFMEEFINSTGTYQLSKTYPFFNLNAQVAMPLRATQAAPLEHLLETLLTIYQSAQPDNEALLFHYLHIFLLETKRNYQSIYPQNQDSLAKTTRLVKAFEQQLEEHFYRLATQQCDQTLAVSELAEQLHVSASYLSEVIRKETGQTASFLIQIRTILEAKSLLRNTDWTISEIAYRLGYEDNSYFARLFKKHTGVSPTGYRQGV